MTDQTIPADKVREILKKLVDDGRGCPEQTLGAVEDSLHALFPAQQPTTGLLGRWATHPEYGDVMCSWDKPGSKGDIPVRWMAENEMGGLCGTTVPLDSLTFPHQATKPADVPAGEAWLIRDMQGNEFNAVKTGNGYYIHDLSDCTWLFCDDDGDGNAITDKGITLVCPLVPERPVSDLQAKYDELEEKYWEQQTQIDKYEQVLNNLRALK